MDKPLKKQSNPFSTGGGGVNFETRVQAAFAVLMLTGSQAPCLPPWPISKIKLQGRYNGFHTDDFVVFTKNPDNGNESKLLAQIKHNISISEKSETFSEVIQAAWEDFNNPDIFNIENDVFALITGPLSANDINNTRIILEWARYSEDEQEFFKKTNLPEFSNSTKKTKLDAFRKNLKKANGGIDLSDKKFWVFLRKFYLLGFDLDVEGGGTLSLLHSIFSRKGVQNPSLLWTRLLDTIQTVNQNAGTLNIENLPRDIKEVFESRSSTNWDSDIKKLTDHSEYIISGIRSTIGEVHINRTSNLQELIEASEKNEFVFLSGERGCGKSSIIREFAEYMKEHAPVFCLRSEDLDKAHLNSVFTSIGLRGSIGELQEGFALMQKKYLLIESLEKLLELQYTTAFTDLLQFVRKNSGWTIIASGRNYAYQQIMFNFLQPSGISCSTVFVKELTDTQIQLLSEKLESLKPLLNIEYIKPLMRNPFFTDIAYRITQAETEFLYSDGEREFQVAVWRDIISKEHVRLDGMPIKRQETFIDIAVKRAKRMVYGISGMEYDPAVILRLEEDNLIIRNPINGLISLAHDVFEDWALVRHIEDIYQNNHENLPEFLKCLGYEPAMNRAFRLWLHQKMRFEDDVTEIILTILNNKKVEKCWQDEAISAVFLGENPNVFLEKLKNQLLIEDSDLLKRFCFILRISSKTPDQEILNGTVNQEDEQSIEPRHLFLKPYGKGWESLIIFFYKNKEQISQKLLPHVLEVLNDWSSLIHIEKDLPSPAREVGLLSLYLLDFIKDSYGNKPERKKLMSIIIKVVSVIPNEFNKILENDVYVTNEKGRRLSYVKELCEISLTGVETVFLAKHSPEMLIKLAFNEWIIKEDIEKNKNQYFYRDKGVEESFGLEEYGSASNFFPPSGLKGPFFQLLRYHPRRGLDFIIELLNFTAEKYANSDLDSPEKYSSLPVEMHSNGVDVVKIQLNDESTIEQYCSDRLWLSYRGFSVMPYLLQSALMALENWLIELAEYNENEKINEWIFNYILKNSNSVAPVAVLVSIAIGYPHKFGEFSLPLIKVPEFYDLEIERKVQEHGRNEINWHNTQLNRDSLAEIYSKERRTAALRKWRKEDLESLVVQLQFTDLSKEVFVVIDDLREKMVGEKLWSFRFHRIDSREWETEVDEENNRIIFSSGKLEPELEEIHMKNQQEQELTNRFLSLALWAEKKFKREVLEQDYYDSWKEALTEAKDLYDKLFNNKVNSLKTLHYAGLIKASALFIRDFSNELSEEDVIWCSEIIIQVISGNIAEDKADITGVGMAASVIPIFLDFAEEEEEKQFFKKLLAITITHPNKTVRVGLANGVREHLWSRDIDFAHKCLSGSIEYSRLILKHSKEKSNFRVVGDFNIESELQEKWVEDLREKIYSKELKIDMESITFSTHSTWDILTPCLMIPNESSDPIHYDFFYRMLSLLYEAEELEKNQSYKYEERIDYELSFNFAQVFAKYLLSLSDAAIELYIEKLKEGCEKAPKLINHLLVCIEYSSEQIDKKNTYWKIWGDLSNKVQDIAISIIGEDFRYPGQNEKVKLIRSMMHADIQWQKIDYENQDIVLGKELIIEFVENAGMNADVFEAMASLMYHFPDVFVDSGLYVLAKHQKETKDIRLFSNVNTPFYLENCIHKLLLENSEVPLTKKMHQSCLILLDAIVETASSKAYYLREHLIRSRRIER